MNATRPLDLVVFTDLDGTLLDHHGYSWRDAAPAVERLRDLRVPLILNSSKTRPEMLALRRELGNPHPFVVENGAAVYVPRGYFDGPVPGAAGHANDEDFEAELLGPPRAEVLDVLHRLRDEHGFAFQGFADFTVEQVCEHTGLGPEAARAAMDRDGTEPLLWLDEDRPPEALARELGAHGLVLVRGGRFWHASGPVDKGSAARRLLERYRRQSPGVRSVGLGDSDNDLSLLRSVDFPVVVPRATGDPLDPGPLPGLVLAPHPGAAGWRRAVDDLLDSHLAEA